MVPLSEAIRVHAVNACEAATSACIQLAQGKLLLPFQVKSLRMAAWMSFMRTMTSGFIKAPAWPSMPALPALLSYVSTIRSIAASNLSGVLQHGNMAMNSQAHCPESMWSPGPSRGGTRLQAADTQHAEVKTTSLHATSHPTFTTAQSDT